MSSCICCVINAHPPPEPAAAFVLGYVLPTYIQHESEVSLLASICSTHRASISRMAANNGELVKAIVNVYTEQT